ncbi:biotin--[acetyl-CoA-carboxylase] ligase [Anaerovorax odorimutans]|uniref:biotin--[acetyl-CoA-carboxylase] ligase n=1 Tax=Anaerovorax odorimutans TaxID=109327 RepID=UPI000411AAB7|nr:biotin--[acetyl-CoA-carboxylase] ligase [Anaerovorax odorimutans]
MTTTKDKVLKILEENKGNSVSGENLAEIIGVSRSAVWKAINELRKEGYFIEAITNKGYCLDKKNDVLSVQGILPFLSDYDTKDKIFVFKTLESTNQTLKKMAIDGAKEGTMVISQEQTKGKGRMGRSFFSQSKSGIYMSILLKPNFGISKSVLITTAASVAVCRAIKKLTNADPKIKWVNDIYINNKKICGILTEAVTDFESGQIEHIVLGIGVNFNTEDFPKEISNVAGSLNTKNTSRNELIAEIYKEVLSINNNLESREFIKDYRSLSLVLGKEIRIYKAGKAPAGNEPDDRSTDFICATAIDIDNNGGLVVKYKDDSVASLNSGEISIRV